MLKDKNKQLNIDPYEDREGLVYARVSSKKQEIEGHGLQSQEGRCIDELKHLKVPYIKTFPDSFSGGGDFMNRPAMRKLLEYIDSRPHKKFVVIFDDLKRFARDVEFHFKLRTAFRIRGVTLKCLNYAFDETDEGEFLELIMAGQAQLERKQNRRQVIQKMKARLDAGYWSFGVKRGYKSIEDPLHGKISVPDGKDANILKEALEGFSTGIFINKIEACRFLISKGFWKGEARKYVYVFDKMLRDPFYAGFIEYPNWEVSRRIGHHKPIISIETFNLNQSRLDGKTALKQVRKDTCDELPLRGLINCAECSKHLTGSKTTGNGGTFWYYFCQNKGCSIFRKSINTDDVNTRFKELLTKNKIKPEAEKLMSVIFEKVWGEEIKNFHSTEKEKIREQKSLEVKIDQFTELIINTKSDVLKKNYEKQLEKIVSEYEGKQKEMGQKIDFNIPYQTAIKKACQLLKSPYSVWEKVETKEKHNLFFFLFQDKLPYSKKDGYQTNKVPNAIRLFEDFVGSCTTDVDPTGLEPATPSLQMRCSTR